MKVNIKVYNKNKYYEDSKVIAEVDFTDIASIERKEIPLIEMLRKTVVSCVIDLNINFHYCHLSNWLFPIDKYIITSYTHYVNTF